MSSSPMGKAVLWGFGFLKSTGTLPYAICSKKDHSYQSDSVVSSNYFDRLLH